MNLADLRLSDPRPAARPDPARRKPLGRHLVDAGAIRPSQLVQALDLQARLDAPLGEILVAEGWVGADDVQRALAEQHGIGHADFSARPPDPRLCARMDRRFWIRHRAIPWFSMGGTVLIATSRPDRFTSLQADLTGAFPTALPVLATAIDIDAAIARHYARDLARDAGTRVEPRFSCRNRDRGSRLILPASLATIIAAAILAPVGTLTGATVIATITLLMFAALKALGFLCHLTGQSHLTAPQTPPRTLPRALPGRMPKISVLVPLFREREIAGALVRRLARLSYPKALLDVILVLEEKDTVTRETLAQTALPPWMRVIEVPAHGPLTTKPRAMNYALDFCRGDIIGVWDAEDAPVPDQLERIASRFAEVPEDVVCLQGILDYYNPRTNWLARCFTIEYASWFRVVLPGIARMGLVVPLGGTTLFFRRDRLEELGGWDAHNVTEDADLGLRLCRAGYRTEMIDTVTYEEANCRPWRWVRQRSRWLKGFMVTWAVHMRQPGRLWRDLGAWKFWGVQAFFLGTLCQFLLAPVLWSFWLLFLGFGHPVADLLPPALVTALIGVMLAAELLTISIGMTACASPERRFLMGWAPTMMLYFPLGTLAAMKALWELLTRPYFWDKTQHGQARADLPLG
ncbi:glycosyltransferase family 2 protein [Pukyongiella litopenaei]|uniref:Glycosyltransferase n=1 Tax=Pukyongiella litopenaei TaxID=2605946 RepID=A0A2S0MT02_9RHOB|nr:glycosyltransferase family 2 protein [Pukyongiella litopenaei]AVO39019.1 glycosyltransferase [Pukyongiella litopenaei]